MTSLPSSQHDETKRHENARSAFEAFVSDKSFPCVGAKSALNRHRLHFGLYEGLGEAASVSRLCSDLQAFAAEFPEPGEEPVSFVAAFAHQAGDEMRFEAALWRHLQAMHQIDSVDNDWDDSVSADPGSPEFSFSIGGRAYFVVGLHPNASRLARRAPLPTLVFNFHNQFEALRASGKYGVLQDAIRKRDLALQGSINPVLSRFGEASEARQYSGRAAGDGWKCPFHTRAAA